MDDIRRDVDPIKTTFLRMDALAAGAWVAAAARGPGGLAALVRPASRAALAAGAVVAALFVRARGLDRDDDPMETIGYTAVAVFWAGVVVLVVAAPPGTAAARALSAGSLRWLGRYSYGLYVNDNSVCG